jgi:hypothetical protein
MFSPKALAMGHADPEEAVFPPAPYFSAGGVQENRSKNKADVG